METSVRIDRKITEDSSNDLELKFKYSSNRYLEILNKEAFGDETLLAQTGGYIGKLIIQANFLKMLQKVLSSISYFDRYF